MRISTVYMLSWLGGDKDANLVLENIKRWQSEGFKVILLAQEWGDIPQPDNVTVIDSPIRLSPAAARNMLMNVFYQTEEDFGLFVDDDVVGVDYLGFIENLRLHGQSDATEIDLVIPMSEDADLIPNRNSYVMKKANGGKGGVFLLKNFIRFKNPPVFFELSYKWIDGKLLYGEDYEFVYGFFRRGYYAWSSTEFTFKTVGDSSWSGEGKLPQSLNHEIYRRKYGEKERVPPIIRQLRKVT